MCVDGVSCDRVCRGCIRRLCVKMVYHVIVYVDRVSCYHVCRGCIRRLCVKMVYHVIVYVDVLFGDYL